MRLSNDSYYDPDFILDDKECKELEQEAMKRLLQAKLELTAAEKVLGSIYRQIIVGTLRRAGIHYGSRVIVEYSDGAEEVIFERIREGLCRQIVVRHLTKKGKPCKAVTYLSYGMEKYIKLKTP